MLPSFFCSNRSSEATPSGNGRLHRLKMSAMICKASTPAGLLKFAFFPSAVKKSAVDAPPTFAFAACFRKPWKNQLMPAPV